MRIVDTIRDILMLELVVHTVTTFRLRHNICCF
jgi:hypothetical protein